MKKQRRTKAKNQTYHFKKRCDERLGIQNKDEYKDKNLMKTFICWIDSLIELHGIDINFRINGI
ncbi:MAG: hypothetical protein LUG16_03385 [Candidatus Gastranaerophilales bacterium]|nr:hypothetical protein [Candidatus Gastranaerophilales bacterium]